MVASCVLFMLLASMKRLLGRRRRKGWSFGLEVIIAAYRGSWSVMPAIGIVRWRKVGEALSPLRTDGLAPRFVRLDHGSGQITGMWLEPPDSDGPVVLYFHGGGFAFASLRTHGNLIGGLARATRARFRVLVQTEPTEEAGPFSGCVWSVAAAGQSSLLWTPLKTVRPCPVSA